MTPTQTDDLLGRYLNHQTSPEENSQVESWYIAQAGHLPAPGEGIDYQAAGQKIWERIEQRTQPKSVTRRKTWLRVTAAAASVMVLASTGVFYHLHQRNPDKQVAQQVAQIVPGGNKAVLTLGDGRRISLTDAAHGDIAEQAGTGITKTTDDQLVYQAEGRKVDPEETWNTLETPNGGQYQILLPDGTAVWLNAASSLTYPANFTDGKQRLVKLTGEAYFEVAKDPRHPFVVSCSGQRVEVLGTHFNINAYNDEGETFTTLLEGSVKVAQTSGAGILLTPGQQAVNSPGELKVQEVNTDFVVEWKNGFFRFDGKDLKTSMMEIARWYNVSVEFRNTTLKNEPLAGRISKYSSIRQVLDKMELTDAFHFKIEGQTVVIE